MGTIGYRFFLYFVRSGRIFLAVSTDAFGSAGYEGNWWSLRGTDNVWGSAGLGGYYLGFTASAVIPSAGPAPRWVAFPLRCLSTVLGMGGKV